MIQNKETITMLHELYQNVLMGEKGTELLMEKTNDSDLLKLLHTFSQRYETVKMTVLSFLSELGEEAKEPGAMEQTSLWMGVQLNTLLDKSTSHIAEMLIQGNAMGIIKGEKNKNRNSEADPKVIKLGDELIKIEEDFTDALKKHLA